MPDCARTVRAFIAVRVSQPIERSILEMVEELRRPGDGIKWVGARNLHLTLKFLGPAVAVGKLEPLGRELEKIAARTASFEIEVAEVGGFPDLRRARVLWVGLRSDALMSLAGALEDAAERCGFERERRAFSAHLTIARIRDPQGWGRTARAVEQARERRFGSCKVAEVILYRSTLSAGGSIYDPIATYPLREEAAVEA